MLEIPRDSLEATQMTMFQPKFRVYKDVSGQWRWRFTAGNGKIVASGEGYRRRIDCLKAVQLIKAEAIDADVELLKQTVRGNR